VRIRILRIQPQSLLELCYCLFRVSRPRQRRSQSRVYGRIVRTQPRRLVKLIERLCGLPLLGQKLP